MLNAEHILLAEDDPDYAVLLQLALQEAGIHDPVHVVSNGLEVIQYLKGEGPYADRTAHPLPALILLDLRLPLEHGFDVLRWIRSQAGLSEIFVAIISGSGLQNEARIAADLGANLFLVKPHTFDELVRSLAQLRNALPQPNLAAAAKN